MLAHLQFEIASCHGFGLWEEDKVPEEKPAGTGRTLKLHTETSQLAFKPATFLLWDDSANHHITHTVIKKIFKKKNPNKYN